MVTSSSSNERVGWWDGTWTRGIGAKARQIGEIEHRRSSRSIQARKVWVSELNVRQLNQAKGKKKAGFELRTQEPKNPRTRGNEEPLGRIETSKEWRVNPSKTARDGNGGGRAEM